MSIRRCELSGCNKPAYDVVGKIWGGAWVCKKHYEEEVKAIGNDVNIGCLHIPEEPPKEEKDE